MPGLLLLAYLVVLLLLPLLARWRWGFVASLVVVLVELAFALIVHRIVLDYGLVSLQLSDTPPEHPKAEITEQSIASFFRDVETFILPALAAVVGGVLSAIWSAGAAIWRAARG